MHFLTFSVLCVFGFASSADILAPGNNFIVVDKPEVPVEEKNDVISPKSTCSCECNFKSRPESKCEWILVFKGVAYSAYHTLGDLKTGGNMNFIPGIKNTVDIIDDKCYRDGSILDSWNDFYIKQVHLELFAEGVRKAWFLFIGVGSNLTNWMSKSRLLASSYDGIRQTDFNYFSVNGAFELRRSFYINQNFSGCEDDCSYMVVLEPAGPPSYKCRYSQYQGLPVFLYGLKNDGCSTMNGVGYGVAD